MKYYTVETANKFSLLSDEDSSSDERIHKVNLAAPVAPVEVKPPSPPRQAGRGTGVESRRGGRGGLRSERGGRGGGRGRPEGAFSVESPEAPANDEGADDVEKSHRREMRRDRGRGRGRGEDAAAGRGREFDRHISGTGRGRELKKAGGGAHNWGNDEAQAGEAEKTEAGWGSAEEGTPEAKVTTTTEPAIEPVEKAREMIDLAEYQRQRAALRVNLPTLPQGQQTRAAEATESELVKQGYEKYVKLPARTTTPGEVRDHDEEDGSKRPKAINFFQLAEESGSSVCLFPGMENRGRGGGRGRGGDDRRGGDRRGGDREQRQERTRPAAAAPKANIDFSDESAFPGLASA